MKFFSIYTLRFLALFITVGKVNSQCTFTTATPYFETFQGLTANDQMPNCWQASDIGGSCKTFSAFPGAFSGQNCAAFYYAPLGTSYFYTQGIYLIAGIHYSASCFYKTNASGATNWTDFSILLAPNQNSLSLSTIASTPVITTSSYLQLSGTFSVTTSGIYHVTISGSCVAGAAEYLYFDNLSIAGLCTGIGAGQSPTVSVTSINSLSPNIACASGTPGLVNLTANGADTYTWTSGNFLSPTFSTTVNPYIDSLYGTMLLFPISVVGTNTLTGCTGTALITAAFSQPVMALWSNVSTTICPGHSATLSIAGSSSSYTWSNGLNGSTITVAPTASSVYSVIGANAAGCTNTASILITVTNTSVFALASSTILCLGTSATLTSGGTASYYWQNIGNTQNQVVVSPSVNTTYTVIGTNIPGCIDTATVTINVDSFPEFGLLGTTSVICMGESSVLTGTGASSYQWAGISLVSNANTATVSPVSSTSYTLTGTNANGCSASESFMVEVNECVGLTRNNMESRAFMISPNPNAGNFEIESDADVFFELRDINGRLILKGEVKSKKVRINIQDAPQGVYFLYLSKNGQSSVYKVVRN